MKKRLSILNNENGSALLISLLILGLLTLLGIFATNTTNIELQIAGNDKLHKVAFYAAEAARGYVAGNTGLYGPDNITSLGPPHYFPNNSDPYIQITSEPSMPYPLSSVESFTGFVEYKNASAPPRGSGYEVGKFKAHNYEMTCNGYGPSNAESRITAGFYRIGF
jgi:hypothetical protein